MIYFDNAATGGIKPVSVINAVTASFKQCVNCGRSGHRLSVTAAKTVLSARLALNDLFDGYGEDGVVFTKNCTEALNTLIFGSLNEGDHVITTCLEHNSVLRPLKELERRNTISLDIVYLKNGRLPYEEFKALMRENTKAVIITLASNVTGFTPDIKRLREEIGDGVLLFCDGAQAAGHFDVKMKSLKIDALAIAGHKGLGAIQGSGALLLSDRVNVIPLTFGGTGSESLSLTQPDFLPDKLESGTLNYHAVLSLLEGAIYTKLRLYDNMKKIKELEEYLISGLSKIEKVTLYSQFNYSGIIAFAIDGVPSEEAAQRLSDEFYIAVRGGLHCAPLMHEALGSLENGLIRVSLSHFNELYECDALLSAVKNF